MFGSYLSLLVKFAPIHTSLLNLYLSKQFKSPFSPFSHFCIEFQQIWLEHATRYSFIFYFLSCLPFKIFNYSLSGSFTYYKVKEKAKARYVQGDINTQTYNKGENFEPTCQLSRYDGPNWQNFLLYTNHNLSFWPFKWADKPQRLKETWLDQSIYQ